MSPQKNNMIKKEAGFSAVELLTVIAIIGILAAIAIPNYTKYKLRSYDTTAKSDLNHLYATCASHWTEKTESFPCTLSVATSTSYGFIASDDVVLTIDDDSFNGFRAMSSHSASNTVYEIGPEGYITIQ